METWKLILLIAAVLAVIIGNIYLLKQTAGFKLDKRIDELKHGKKITATGHKPDDKDQQPPSTRI
jgi:hypothetical protein